MLRATPTERVIARFDRCNTRRLLEPIGNVPPAEAEARYYAQLEPAAMAA